MFTPKKRKKAIFTSFYDESFFLNIFLDYYSKFFKQTDIYVVQHVCKSVAQEKLSNERCNVIIWEHDILCDEKARYEFLNQVYRKLILKYETVIFSDIDEILAPDPEEYPGGLSEYIDRINDQRFVRTKGFEVLHVPEEEPPLDFCKKPYLSQRKWWARNITFDKFLINRNYVKLYPGCHETNMTTEIFKETGKVIPYDPDLLLIHLKRIDYNLCKDKAFKLAGVKYIDSTYGLHNLLRNFNGYYYETISEYKSDSKGIVSMQKVNMKDVKVMIEEKYKTLV